MSYPRISFYTLTFFRLKTCISLSECTLFASSLIFIPSHGDYMLGIGLMRGFVHSPVSHADGDRELEPVGESELVHELLGIRVTLAPNADTAVITGLQSLLRKSSAVSPEALAAV